jgi:hypothetical protein
MQYQPLNEVESIDTLAPIETEEVVAPTKRRGKHKPLPADLPRIDVIHDLPEHELPAFAVAANMPSAKKTENSWRLCRCKSG